MKMAQPNPIIRDDISASTAVRNELERLAAEQGVQPITDFDSLRADFWPEQESVADFVRIVRVRRRHSGRRSVE